MRAFFQTEGSPCPYTGFVTGRCGLTKVQRLLTERRVGVLFYRYSAWRCDITVKPFFRFADLLHRRSPSGLTLKIKPKNRRYNHALNPITNLIRSMLITASSLHPRLSRVTDLMMTNSNPALDQLVSQYYLYGSTPEKAKLRNNLMKN